MLDHYHANSYVWCVGSARVSVEERLGHHIFQDIYYAHFDESYGLDFFERSHPDQPNLHSVCECRIALHNYRRYIRNLAQF